MNTLLLDRSDVARLVDVDDLNMAMRSAFAAYSQGREIPAQRFHTGLPGAGDAMVLMPGLAEGIPAYTVKVNAKFPNRWPAIRGVVVLNDLDSGAPLAVLDSYEITAVRTGLAAAMATDMLARYSARRVAVVGAGVQGMYQLRFLSGLRKIDSIVVYDTSAEKAANYAASMGAELALDISVADSLEAVLKDAEIVLMATWAKQPILFAGMVPAGCHVTTLGADEPGEAEIDAALVRHSIFVCDDRAMAMEMGAVGGAGLGPECIDAEIGEVILGTHPGRTHPDQITVYGAVGLAFQDLVAAWQVYQAALYFKDCDDFDFLA